MNSDTSPPRFPIHKLADRHPGLTEAIAEYYLEAARVCLDRHHSPPQELVVESEKSGITSVVDWLATDELQKRAWANEIDATEAGACACALAAVELAEGYVAIGRAETLTGADYYVSNKPQRSVDLEEAVRLEISGTSRGNKTLIEYRLREKLRQAARGNSNLPAMACVVGFKARLVKMGSV